MTSNLIYGKTVTVQADQFTVTAPSSFSQPITYPTTQNSINQTPYAPISNSGFFQILSPAVTGPPISIAAGAITIYVFDGVRIAPTLQLIRIQVAPSVLAILGTLTAGVASILIPGFMPLGYRTLGGQRVPIAGAVGPVAAPTTLIFQFEVNGDVRIFKNSIDTAWVATDTLTLGGCQTGAVLLCV